MNSSPGVETQDRGQLCLGAVYGIAARVYVCVTPHGSVILDVNRDKYLGVGRAETEMLAGAVAGWPGPRWSPTLGLEKSQENEAWQRVVRQTCDSLVEDGVLEKVPAGGVARAVATLGDMRGEWISVGDEWEVRGRVTFRHVVNFATAFVWARWSLTLRPFRAVVDEIKACKREAVRQDAASHPKAVAALVDVFRRLRPFVFAPEERCLLHAVTLMKFLCRYGLGPEWVIGVTTQPWAAHSWVQWGNFLLDSDPEKVCAFTPIMVV
jgi:Transglutaminase-like superfamily